MTSHPSHRPVSALRARMIEDMRVRGFRTCISAVLPPAPHLSDRSANARKSRAGRPL